MLHERIRALRQKRGMSQEEVAERIHVVRQTVSKWEQGLSAPDAEMLVRLAEVLEVTPGELLGEEASGQTDALEARLTEIAAQLEGINAGLARRSQRERILRRLAGWGMLALAGLTVLGTILRTAVHLLSGRTPMPPDPTAAVIGGADSPTAILVVSRISWPGVVLALAAAAVLAAGGVLLLRRLRRE